MVWYLPFLHILKGAEDARRENQEKKAFMYSAIISFHALERCIDEDSYDVISAASILFRFLNNLG